jgi:hypothetical protein
MVVTEAALQWDEEWDSHASIVGAGATVAHRLESGSLLRSVTYSEYGAEAMSHPGWPV